MKIHLLKATALALLSTVSVYAGGDDGEEAIREVAVSHLSAIFIQLHILVVVPKVWSLASSTI